MNETTSEATGYPPADDDLDAFTSEDTLEMEIDPAEFGLNEDGLPTTLRRLTHTVHLAEDEGARADVVAGRRIPELTRRTARKMALEGHMFVAGDRAPPSRRVAFGESIEFQWYEEQPEHAHELVVLASTPRFVYAYKPPGMHTHRLRPNQPLALADLVVRRFPECRAAAHDHREGGAIHRLDGETSGVVAFARSRKSWDRARAGFEAQQIGKLYLGLARATETTREPWPPEAPRGWGYSISPGALARERLLVAAEGLAALDPSGELRESRPAGGFAGEAIELRVPLGQGARRGQVAVRPDGRSSRSLLRPVVCARVGDEARVLLAIELISGHRHQARAHLAWLGLPLVGDALYGDGDAEVTQRLRLHAFAIDLSEVFRDEQVVLAPVPAGFYDALR